MENWNPRYADAYFTPGLGAEESRYVFFEGNSLSQRLPERLISFHTRFTIVETGFGSSLNFLTAMQLSRRMPVPLPGRVLFYSVDEDPMEISDMKTLLSTEVGEHSPLLEPLANMCDPPPVGEWGSCSFPGQPHWELFLYHGDVRDFLHQLIDRGVQSDAFFLDGHAPAANPGMWSEEVYRSCARISSPGATAASYTAAGDVKRGLRNAGFQVKRYPGFGQKRHMIRCSLTTGSSNG